MKDDKALLFLAGGIALIALASGLRAKAEELRKEEEERVQKVEATLRQMAAMAARRVEEARKAAEARPEAPPRREPEHVRKLKEEILRKPPSIELIKKIAKMPEPQFRRFIVLLRASPRARERLAQAQWAAEYLEAWARGEIKEIPKVLPRRPLPIPDGGVFYNRVVWALKKRLPGPVR